MSSIAQDIRHALRTLRQRPGFYGAALLTLAVGIGANLTVFSIVNALLLRPLPFGDRSDRVVTLFATHAQQPEDWSWGDSEVSYPDLLDLGEATSLEGLGGYVGRNVTLSRDGVAERVRAGSVTPDLFPLLGITPVLGRHFMAEEAAAPGLESVVLLTHGLWQRRYGGVADIVGREVHVNGLPRTVVGVLPPGFRFPERDDMYMPLRWDESPRDARNVNAVGLLRPGVSVDQAQQELSAIAGRLEQEYADTNRGFGVRVMRFRDSQVKPDTRGLFGTLMTAVGLVLLIACANLANLMLVRAAGRQREMAVRAALGAGGWRLARQMLVETGVVSAAGAALGLIGSAWALDYLRGSFPEELPYWLAFDVDVRVAAFTVAVTALTTVAIGLVPALRAASPNLLSDLKDATRATPSRRQQRLQASLVGAQIALSLALLAGASMTIRGFLAQQTTDLGFDHRPLVSLRTYLAGDEFDDPAARARVVDEMSAALASLPGVASAAATTSIPGDDGGGLVRVVVDGRTDPDAALGAQVVGVTAGFLDTLGLSLLDGRGLTKAEADDPDARVTVINASLAQRLWPAGGAVGSRIGVRSRTSVDWYRIVGVAPDVHFEEVGEATEQSRLNLYVPQAVTGYRTMAFLARAVGAPDPLVDAVRTLMRQRYPGQAVFELMTLNERRRFVTWEQRFLGEMMGTFAMMALGLAGLGVYALLSYAARRRLSEIGVRLALGAAPGDVVRLFLRQGLAIAVIGLGIGLALAAGVAAVLEGLVFGADAWDPLHVMRAAGVLAVTVLLASYLPARRASRTDPTSALRAE
ncbi:MAG: ABC transporter permease [Vicinamibacterales bacterium]